MNDALSHLRAMIGQPIITISLENFSIYMLFASDCIMFYGNFGLVKFDGTGFEYYGPSRKGCLSALWQEIDASLDGVTFEDNTYTVKLSTGSILTWSISDTRYSGRVQSRSNYNGSDM